VVTASRLDTHGVVVGDAISMPDTSVCEEEKRLSLWSFMATVCQFKFNMGRVTCMYVYRHYLSDRVDV